MLLAGKSIVVTGGNSGIGESIVLAAAAEGANVVVDYVSHPEETTALIARVEAAGGRAVGVRADVSRVADLCAMIQTAVDTYGRLDVLINNAGIETRTSLLDTSEADFDKVVAVNMKSAFFGTQAAARQFITQGGGGLVINISSVHEDWPMPGNIAYCVSKGGIRMLTRTVELVVGRNRPQTRNDDGRARGTACPAGRRTGSCRSGDQPGTRWPTGPVTFCQRQQPRRRPSLAGHARSRCIIRRSSRTSWQLDG